MVASNEFNPNKVTKGDQFSSFNVDDFPIPGGRDEVWRFISLRSLRGMHNGEFAPVAAQNIKVTTPSGVTTETVSPQDPRLGRAGAPTDRVAAQAWTAMPQAQVVTIEPEAHPVEPITVTISGNGLDSTTFGATVIEAGHHSETTVLLKYEGTGTHSDTVEFIVQEGAHLNVVVDADWNDDSVHLSHHIAQLGRDSVLRHTAAIFGGNVVRMVPRVSFTGSGADAEMLGIYFADSGQYFENRLLVDHAIPNCRSNVMYKGALQNTVDVKDRKAEARTCWVGDVLIRSTAQGTDTYETNNNLILTGGARADAIPNLEIETGEIAGAGHAATVGRFDDQEVFYLMSRGIPEEEARRLIIRGFFSEVIGRIQIESLRQDLEERVAEELAKSDKQ